MGSKEQSIIMGKLCQAKMDLFTNYVYASGYCSNCASNFGFCKECGGDLKGELAWEGVHFGGCNSWRVYTDDPHKDCYGQKGLIDAKVGDGRRLARRDPPVLMRLLDQIREADRQRQ